MQLRLRQLEPGDLFRFIGRAYGLLEYRGNGWYGSQAGYDGGPWNSHDLGELVEVISLVPRTFRQEGTDAITGESRDQGCLLTASVKHVGAFQVTRFDERGFWGDTEYPSYDKALDEVYDDGYTKCDPAWFEQLCLTDEWRRGMDSAHFVAKFNKCDYMGLHTFEPVTA